MTETLNLQSDTMLEQRANALRHHREAWHEANDSWPAAAGHGFERIACSHRSPSRHRVVLDRDEGVALVTIDGGRAYVTACSDSPSGARAFLEQLRSEIPQADDSDVGLVPVTFWTNSPHGPTSIRRDIDAPAFEDIEGNYPAASELLSLLHDWTPGAGGQLLLWYGDAGTGKTTALRSLGREWRDWAELHYIVDPDRFFGDSASYMMQVMMGDGGVTIGSDELAEPKWRVLVLEDCGEMLAPDARRDVGQALSRLLNACDGLIGRGLRLLILITTNEPLSKMHPAITRPGRCAARLEFERFTPSGAAFWLQDHGRGDAHPTAAMTLADLYAMRDGHRAEQTRRPAGFLA